MYAKVTNKQKSKKKKEPRRLSRFNEPVKKNISYLRHFHFHSLVLRTIIHAACFFHWILSKSFIFTSRSRDHSFRAALLADAYVPTRKTRFQPCSTTPGRKNELGMGCNYFHRKLECNTDWHCIVSRRDCIPFRCN